MARNGIKNNDILDIIFERVELIYYDNHSTPKEMAKRTGLSEDTIIRILKKETISLNSLITVCQTYNIYPDYMFGKTDNPYPYIAKEHDLFNKSAKYTNHKGDVDNYQIFLNSEQVITIESFERLIGITKIKSKKEKYIHFISWFMKYVMQE